MVTFSVSVCVWSASVQHWQCVASQRVLGQSVAQWQCMSRAVSTGRVSREDASVMTTRVETISRMIETDLRLVELPPTHHQLTR